LQALFHLHLLEHSIMQFCFIKQQPTYEIEPCLEFRRVLSRSTPTRRTSPTPCIPLTRCFGGPAAQAAAGGNPRAPLASARRRPQIGRASCRERGETARDSGGRQEQQQRPPRTTLRQHRSAPTA